MAAKRRSGRPRTPPGTRPARSQNAPPGCRRCSAADLNICDRSDPRLILPFSFSAPLILYSVRRPQKWKEITHHLLHFSVVQGIFLLSTERLSRSTLHFKEGERGVCSLVLCSLVTVASCIDASVQIVTKSPKVGPLLIFSISLCGPK